MSDPVLSVHPLGFVWQTWDPFLFCVHHDDAYPAGDARMGPKASLAGRDLGQDFAGKDGWRMYHGRVVPGFPSHPHRGFETVTLARRGYIDHSDSLGAAARFGRGDAQWMTAGGGVVHSEMFPLLQPDQPNPVELFQIWLNLPAEDKMAPPYFSMLWDERIPKITHTDEAGRTTLITLVAGRWPGADAPPSPPPRSWASRPDSDVMIASFVVGPDATVTLPPTLATTGRSVYLFAGSARIGGKKLAPPVGVRVKPDVPLVVEAGAQGAELLLLQGRPIGQPVAQHGPFVMNDRAGLQRAYEDYQRTRFGGWPWPSSDPVHPRAAGRFARHADGRVEEP